MTFISHVRQRRITNILQLFFEICQFRHRGKFLKFDISDNDGYPTSKGETVFVDFASSLVRNGFSSKCSSFLYVKGSLIGYTQKYRSAVTR